MTRRRLLLTLGAGLIVLGCWATVRHFCPRRFTEEMASRVHTGMSEEEVDAALGEPAGDYTGGRGVLVLTPENPCMPGCFFGTNYVWRKYSWVKNGSFASKGWVGYEGAVVVYFGPDGKVTDCWWQGVWLKDSPPFLDRLRAALLRLFR